MQPERADFFLPDDPKRHELVIDIDTDEEVYLPRGSPVGTKSIHKHYLSRPESIESIWYMYRITGDHRYQVRAVAQRVDPFGGVGLLISFGIGRGE